MTRSLDEVHRDIISVADLGIGRNCGKLNSDLHIPCIDRFSLVSSEIANENIGSVEFENFLLSIRPRQDRFPKAASAEFLKVFNDVATMVKPYVDGICADISIDGLDNTPQGFLPPLPASTASWILISYAQEYVAVSDFSYEGPQICRNLLEVLKIGRLPVGFIDKPRGGGALGVLRHRFT